MLQGGLLAQQRRLRAGNVSAFGVEIEVLGDEALQSATQSDGDDTGQTASEMLASQIAST